MRKILYAGMGILALAACQNTPKSTDGFIVQGHISGMDTGKILVNHRENGNAINDTLKLDHGNFSFSGKVSEPTVYYISVSDTTEPLMFFVDPQHITIAAVADSLSSAKVTGSDAQDAYLDYSRQMKPFDDRTNALENVYETDQKNGTIKTEEDSLNNAYDNIETDRKAAIAVYVKSHPASVVGAWAITRTFLYEPDPAVLSELYQSLDSSVRNTSYGKLIDTCMIVAGKVATGQTAPDFTQNDPDGKPLSLSSLRGKYVLVDFWASWCGPCRAENPNVVKAFNQYKDKGFTILGVSLDKSKEPWLKAIQDDHLDWNQVSDLQFWNNRVAKEYGIRAIPSNFLLDKDGKILARNLRGDKLNQELAELFK